MPWWEVVLYLMVIPAVVVGFILGLLGWHTCRDRHPPRRPPPRPKRRD